MKRGPRKAASRYVLWARPGRRYQFSSLRTDAAAHRRWVANEFHRKVLFPGFRKWCTEGCFGEYLLDAGHDRARNCPSCGRWTKDRPGWHETRPSACARCAAAFLIPIDESPIRSRTLRSVLDRASRSTLAPGLAPAAVLEKFAAMQMVDVHVPSIDARELVLSRYTQPDQDQRLVLQELKLTLPEPPPPRIYARAS